jgi:2-oxoglutarate ferredoxin oxidoreductase subunit alpha
MLGGNYLASGIEHNETGSPTASGEVHARMNEKRFHKLEPLQRRSDLFQIEGDATAPLALVSWGSVAGVARRRSAWPGAKVPGEALVFRLLYPVAERCTDSSRGKAASSEQSHQPASPSAADVRGSAEGRF